jgi:hypothetical protein
MPCRLCQTNDREALAEQLAEEMWESRREPDFDGPWERAGPYWQEIMRQFATSTLNMLSRDHG